MSLDPTVGPMAACPAVVKSNTPAIGSAQQSKAMRNGRRVETILLTMVASIGLGLALRLAGGKDRQASCPSAQMAVRCIATRPMLSAW